MHNYDMLALYYNSQANLHVNYALFVVIIILIAKFNLMAINTFYRQLWGQDYDRIYFNTNNSYREVIPY